MDRIERISGLDSGVIGVSFECEEKLIYNASALVSTLFVESAKYFNTEVLLDYDISSKCKV